jgi:hypothetical protein
VAGTVVGVKSTVVIDSQGDLFQTLLKAKVLPSEDIALINPEDIGCPAGRTSWRVIRRWNASASTPSS